MTSDRNVEQFVTEVLDRHSECSFLYGIKIPSFNILCAHKKTEPSFNLSSNQNDDFGMDTNQLQNRSLVPWERTTTKI